MENAIAKLKKEAVRVEAQKQVLQMKKPPDIQSVRKQAKTFV